ncbi:MAG: Rieske 2Fe-2S domain-containing protein [Novosphingobium sp.]|nr:Rieske 2Fe-2S domain-containing protein [Novosphingobium sp.]
MARWLLNCWYMAGWSHEVGENGLARRIIDRPVFVYRLGDGSIAAVLDRCPHRFAPLSRGSRDGDNLVCGYHGLAFSPEGKCIRNPFSERIPAGTDIEGFAAIERHDIVWIWAGEREKADPSLIPDFSFVPDTPFSRTIHGYTAMKANYEYGTDNLLDLSHIEFVHKGTFAGQGVIFAGEHSVRAEGDTLHSDWFMPGIPPPSVAYGRFAPDSLVDHWLEMRWNAPASMRLAVGVCSHCQARETGFELPQAHILTPASEHETHYFWSSTRYHDLDSIETDHMLANLFGEAFDLEDKPMIEAAYDNVRGKDFWSQKPASLGIDQGGTRARRMLEKLIRDESASSAA